MARTVILAVVLTVVVMPARAQIVVHDPGNFAQAVLIAQRTLREYQVLWDQYQTILRMARGLGHMERYRIPSTPSTRHDVDRWEYARPWLEGLNSGDPDGAAYAQTARRLERPGATLEQLPMAARRAVEEAYATVEITDSVAQTGGHQLALVREYSRRLQQAIRALEGDVTSSDPRSHDMTAVLDKVAAGELIARRQDMAANQLLSHALEQLLARGKRLRDTEAAAMNMRLVGMRDSRVAGASLVKDAASDLRTWRQP
jgi:hypothetical protein